tara:strand:- start:204 stop:449 length:246 start_codon:yes stop_codon:yes gene_type:complete
MSDDTPIEEVDDNPKILKLIKERLDIGVERYGHGLRHGDDTRQWGTKTDSWTEMGLEEALDMTLYLACQIIRIMEREKKDD